MSCGAGNPTFRLLDPYVGWSEESVVNLTGLESDNLDGVQLDLRVPDAVSPSKLAALIPPARLARGCGGCEWFLLTETDLLRRDCCTRSWNSVWGDACHPRLLKNAKAISFSRHRIAVSDPGAGRVHVWDREGDRLSSSIPLDHPGPLAFLPWDGLVVVDMAIPSLLGFGYSGEPRGTIEKALPEGVLNGSEIIDRIAGSRDCAIWLVARTKDGTYKLYRASRDDSEFAAAAIEDLEKAFRPNGLLFAGDDGFCLEECGPEGMPVRSCFNWHGEASLEDVAPPPEPSRHKQGQLLTTMIDSGIPRCRWHRVRVVAEIPLGTSLAVAVATSEVDNPSHQGIPETGWESFPAGTPHPIDWQRVSAGSLDFLINQPPGRYLFLRLRLEGDGRATPVVRRIRLDLPRLTSLEFLPPVYRETNEAEDFTERFLALFDSAIADLDRAIERSPALLDPDALPDEALPWLGSFLDVAFDPSWPADRRRGILNALPELYRRRGTPAGLAEAIRLVFDVNPAIQEPASERSWGSVGGRQGSVRHGSRLGSVRLFGRSRARFRLNSSALGSAPLQSYGSPDHDPLLAQAWRFQVSVPGQTMKSPLAQARLRQLIDSQKPAHTIATVRTGGDGFILGAGSTVGVDTVFAPLPPPVLGRAGNIRLNRSSLVWRGKRGAQSGVRLGQTAIVGTQTIVE